MGCANSSVEAAQGPATTRLPETRRQETSRCFFDSYRLGPVLGKGAFAEVRVAVPSGCGPNKAVKILDLNGGQRANPNKPPSSYKVDPGKRLKATAEVSIWQKLMEKSSPHIVRLHDVFWDGPTCYLVMERCECTLLQALRQVEDLSEAFLAGLFHQMLSALSTLHELQIIHRDVKPDNLMMGSDGRIKLCDFGLSTVLSKGRAGHGVVGTGPYMSPEILSRTAYSEKTDVWSLGVVMYLLLFGEYPYASWTRCNDTMKKAIREGIITPTFRPRLLHRQWALPSSGLSALLQSMLERNQQHRPTSEVVLESVYWQTIPTSPAVPGTSFTPALMMAMQAGAFSRPQTGTEASSPVATKSLAGTPSQDSFATSKTSAATGRLALEECGGAQSQASSSPTSGIPSLVLPSPPLKMTLVTV